MAISRAEFQIKMLAFGMADRAIRSPFEIDERVAEESLQIFIRTPGLKDQHEDAQKVIRALDALGAVSEDEVDKKGQLRRAAWEAFYTLDLNFDHNMSYEDYVRQKPAFIPFEEENRV